MMFDVFHCFCFSAGQLGGSHSEAEAVDEPGRFAATVLKAMTRWEM